MKILRIVHNLFTVIALLFAMYISNGIEASVSNIVWSYIIFIIVVVLLVIRFIYEEKQREKNNP